MIFLRTHRFPATVIGLILLTGTVVLAPLTTLKPASATNHSNIANGSRSPSPQPGDKRPASHSPEPGRSPKRVRINSAEVEKAVQHLPNELKLQIMENMTWDHYQAMKGVWHLPDAQPALVRKMHQNTHDYQMNHVIQQLTGFHIS